MQGTLFPLEMLYASLNEANVREKCSGEKRFIGRSRVSVPRKKRERGRAFAMLDVALVRGRQR